MYYTIGKIEHIPEDLYKHASTEKIALEMEEDIPTHQTDKRDGRIKQMEDEINEKYKLVEDLESERDELKNQVSKLQMDLQGEEILKGSK